MTLEIVTVPCLQDNYAYLLHDAASGDTALVDAPEAAPILSALAERGWTLGTILLTHHHADHVQATDELRAATGARVIGAAADRHRLPALDAAVAEGDPLSVCGETVGVIDVSGHTVGHVAFHFPQSSAVFSGDSLMAGGCGRLFEGTPGMMWESLRKLRALPPETLVCSGHEYTTGNIAFALTIEPGNTMLKSRQSEVTAARARQQPTVPSLLSEELSTNPFLRPEQADIRTTLGFGRDAEDAEVFAEIRRRKDVF